MHGEEGKGPLAAVMVTDANANGNEAGHRALAEKRGGETESTIGELHGLMANITVALVLLAEGTVPLRDLRPQILRRGARAGEFNSPQA